MSSEREVLEATRKKLIKEIANTDRSDSEGQKKAGKKEDELKATDQKLAEIGDLVMPRLLADDVTPEALGRLLAHHGKIAVIAAESPLLDNLVIGRNGAGLTAGGRADLAWRLNHLRVPFGNRLLSEISAEDVDRYALAKKQAGLSATSVNKTLTVLSGGLHLEHQQESSRLGCGGSDGAGQHPPTSTPAPRPGEGQRR